jgi:hypothetical protein
MIRGLIRLVALLALLAASAVLYDRWQIREDFSEIPLLDPMPRTQELITLERWADAEAYLRYFVEHNSSAVTPQARELLEAIQEKRQSWSYRTKALLEGAVTGRGDEIEEMIGAGVADLFVVGDIRDAVIEGAHWIKGEEVDEVMLALSSLGIAATAATVATAGGSAGLKGSLSVLKQMRRSKYLPRWFTKALLRLPRSSHKMKRSANALLEPIADLYRHGGWRTTREMLHHSRSLEELNRMRRLTKIYKRESAILLRIDPAALRLAEHFPPRTITRASLHGKPAFKQLARQLKYTARLSKIVSKQWIDWIRHIPRSWAIGVWILSAWLLLFPYGIPMRR